MLCLEKEQKIFIFLLLGIVLVSVLTGTNLIISLLFLACSLIGMLLTKCVSYEENLFYILIISSIFEYTYSFGGHGKIYLFHVLLFVFSLFTLFRIIKDKNILYKFDKKIVLFFAAWFAYICISILWASSKGLALRYIVIYALMYIFMINIVVFNLNNTERLKNTFKIIVFMFGVSIAVGLVEAITAHQLPVVHYYNNFTQYKLTAVEILGLQSRPISFFYNPNNFATFIAMCISFLLILPYFADNIKSKVIIYILNAVCFVVLILSASRLGIIATAFMIITTIIFGLMEKGKKALLPALILIAIFALAYTNSYRITNDKDYLTKMDQINKTYSNLAEKKNEVGTAGSDGERISVYYDIVHGVLFEKHFFGFGAGNTSRFLIQKGNTNKTYDPHGWLTEILGDFGIPILLAYAVFYVYLIINLFKVSRKNDIKTKIVAYSFLATLFGFIFGSFSPSSIVYFLPHWLLYGIVISFLQKYRTETEG